MPTSYILLKPDRFRQQFNKHSAYQPWEGYDHVRRPFRGILLKRDTYATLRIVDEEGKPILIHNASSREKKPLSIKYSNFLLQNITEQRQEKVQIVETFGEPYYLFFGERPRIVRFSGILLNTPDFKWKDEFLKNYDELFRGTKLVEKKARIILSWEDVVIEGYLLSVNVQEQSNQPNVANCMFEIALTDYAQRTPITNRLPYSRTFGVWIDKSWEVSAGSGEEIFKSTTDDVWKANIEDIKKKLADPKRQLLAAADVVAAALKQTPQLLGDVSTIASAFRQGNAMQLGSMAATFSYQSFLALLPSQKKNEADLPYVPKRYINNLALVRELEALGKKLFGAAYSEPIKISRRELTPPKGKGYIYENEDEYINAKRHYFIGRETLEEFLERTEPPPIKSFSIDQRPEDLMLLRSKYLEAEKRLPAEVDDIVFGYAKA